MTKRMTLAAALLVLGLLCSCHTAGIDKKGYMLNNNTMDIEDNGFDTYDGQTEYYLKEAGKVYFVTVGFVDIKYYRNKTLLEGADYASFTPLGPQDEKSPVVFAKDDARVYYQSHIISGADPVSFELIRGYFAKDKHHVYYTGDVIENADPATFSALSSIYGKDGKSVYYFNVWVEQADVETFQPCKDYPYAVDKSNVYYANHILRGADPASFDVLDGYYVKDADNVFFLGEKIDLDLASLQIINKNFVLDKNYVYHDGKKIPGSDPATFEILDSYYHDIKEKRNDIIAKDKNTVYYRFGR